MSPLLTGGISALGGGGIPVLGVVPGLGGLLGRGLMGLFGGGPTQSQKQEQTQNQNQNQSQTSTSNASASSSAYNNLTINYPNESAGMALQGLLSGAGAPFNPIGAPGVEQEEGSFAPQAGYQAPGMVQPQAVQVLSPAGSSFMAPAGGGGSAATAPYAPPNLAPPAQQPQVFSAGPGGGAINPGAAQQALQASQAVAPSGSGFVGQAQQPQLIASGPSPVAQGQAFGYAPNPYAPSPVVTDATNAQQLPSGASASDSGAGGGSAPDAVANLPSPMPELPGLRATEAESPFVLKRPKEPQTEREANEPSQAVEYNIPSNLPAPLKAKLREEYHQLANVEIEAQNDQVPGTNMKRKEYQAALQAQVDEAREGLNEAAKLLKGHVDLSARAAERQYRRDMHESQNLDLQSPDSETNSVIDRAVSMQDRLEDAAVKRVRGAMSGRSLQYSSSPTHGQDILGNANWAYKVGNFLNPGRVRNAQNYVNNVYAQQLKELKDRVDDELRSEEIIDKRHEALRENARKNIEARANILKQQETFAARALAQDKRLENSFITARRNEIFKNIYKSVDQFNSVANAAQLNAYRTVENNLATLKFQFQRQMDVRVAEDREAHNAILEQQGYNGLQMREQLLPSEIERNYAMANPYGQLTQPGGAPPQPRFTPEMQQAQTSRTQALNGAMQNRPPRPGLVPPPPATTPTASQLGPGAMAPGLAGMRQSLKAQVVAGSMTPQQAAAILQAAQQAGVK